MPFGRVTFTYKLNYDDRKNKSQNKTTALLTETPLHPK